MGSPRAYHTATLLGDGRVLVAGGISWHSDRPGGWLDSVEIYEPEVDRWRVAAPMLAAHSDHTATLLRDGRVLIVGGAVSLAAPQNEAELYDPVAGRWLPAAPMLAFERVGAATALLPDGRVFVVGGSSAPHAEIYDPTRDRWSAVAQPPEPAVVDPATGPPLSMRNRATATLLPDGTVLIAGGVVDYFRGDTTAAEIYDPAADTWARSGPMVSARLFHAAAALPDGRVLVVGGAPPVESDAPDVPLLLAELYDPAARTWAAAGPPSEPLSSYTATALPGGRVFVVGGATVRRFDPATGVWTEVGPLRQARYAHTVTLLPDDTLLIVGGTVTTGAEIAVVERYRPAP